MYIQSVLCNLQLMSLINLIIYLWKFRTSVDASEKSLILAMSDEIIIICINFIIMQSNQAEKFINAHFIACGFYPEYIVSQNSLLKILDRMSGRMFDRSLASELFERCQKNFRGDIRIQNFIEVLLEALSVLQQKIQQFNQTIEEYTVKRNECLYQISLQKNGSHNKTILVINVIEAQNIFQGEQKADSKPYVVVRCESQQLATNLAQNDKFNPVWNQTLRFEIQTGKEKTQATVLYMDQQKKSVFAGETHISLLELNGQSVYNQWFNLYGRRGEQVPGQLHLELQKLSDQKAYYQEALNQIESHIILLDKDKQQFSQDMQMIYGAFDKKVMQGPITRIMIDSPPLMFISELTRPVIYKNNEKMDIARFKNPLLSDEDADAILHNQQQRFVDVETDYPAQDDLAQKANFGYPGADSLIQVTVGVLCLFLAVSLSLCWLRSDFINITLSLLCFLIVTFNYFETNYLNSMALLLIISSIFDCVWISAQRLVWQSDTFGQIGYVQYTMKLHNLIYYVNLFTIFLKLGISYLMWRIKPIAQFLNSRGQFGLGYYLYNADAGPINPLIYNLRHELILH